MHATDPMRACQWPLNAEGIWLRISPASRAAARPALFIDRDGVLVEEVNHLHRVEDVQVLEGAAQLIATANRAGVPVAMVTNQSGIARGMYDWRAFAAVQTEIEARLAVAGAQLDAIAACPFHPDFTPGYGANQAAWRKPGPAMVNRIAEALGLDRSRSWLVGDTASDLGAARNAGLAGAVIVMTGHGRHERDSALALERPGFKVFAADDAHEAVRHLAPLFAASRAQP